MSEEKQIEERRIALQRLADAVKRRNRPTNGEIVLYDKSGNMYSQIVDGNDILWEDSMGRLFTGNPDELISDEEYDDQRLDNILKESKTIEEVAERIYKEQGIFYATLISEIESKGGKTENYTSAFEAHGLADFKCEHKQTLMNYFDSDQDIDSAITWAIGREYAHAGENIDRIPGDVLFDVKFLEGFLSEYEVEDRYDESVPGLLEWVNLSFEKAWLSAEQQCRSTTRTSGEKAILKDDGKGGIG